MITGSEKNHLHEEIKSIVIEDLNTKRGSDIHYNIEDVMRFVYDLQISKGHDEARGIILAAIVPSILLSHMAVYPTVAQYLTPYAQRIAELAGQVGDREIVKAIINSEKEQRKTQTPSHLSDKKLYTIRFQVNAIGRPMIKELFESNKSHSFKSMMIEFECFGYATLMFKAERTRFTLPLLEFAKNYFTKTISGITTGGHLGSPIYEYLNEDYIQEKITLFLKDLHGFELGLYPKYTMTSIIVKPLCDPLVVKDLVYRTEESDGFLQCYQSWRDELFSLWNKLELA